MSGYPAAAGAVIELRLVRCRAALGAADEMLEYVRGTAGAGPAFVGVAGFRAGIRGPGGGGGGPGVWRSWEAPEGCLDLSGQIWPRSCARLGLLIAGGRFDAARSRLRAVAAGRGLRRTGRPRNRFWRRCSGSTEFLVRPPELLSEREKEVLERLGRLQDKQIATELGLTGHGVRYHLRKLFAKLGANTRADALRRARELDLLPGEP